MVDMLSMQWEFTGSVVPVLDWLINREERSSIMSCGCDCVKSVMNLCVSLAVN